MFLRFCGAILVAAAVHPACFAESSAATISTDEFALEVERVLPREEPFEYHRRLAEGPVHVARRNLEAKPSASEIELPAQAWKLVWKLQDSVVLEGAVHDFQDYLHTSMGVEVTIEGRNSLEDWQDLSQCIVAGTREELPGCGAALKAPKDYEIIATPERVTVCGYDARGVMFGLYNIEARMNLREAPCLPADLHTVRHSRYDARMVQSWMGWMEYPDAVLAHMAHDGFDAIYASAYTNPNGDRTTAETSTDFYARLMHRIRRQDPARVHDLIARAARFGIKVYTPIIYQYTGTPESEADLRRLVREILAEFPDIHGYVLLTEGFWYKTWGGGHGASAEYMRDWAQNWCHAVGVVAEECHRVNPAIEVLPWEYNIDFRPQNVEMKRYFIQQLPSDTIPLLTWENGKSFDIDGLQGYLRDYAINQVGPAEVTGAQIAEARGRGMKVYSNAQTFVCGAQLQTLPYHPFPYQWHERYMAMDALAIDGTLESWSTGYTPNFMTELRAWYCWTDAPPLDELLGAIATREFGAHGREPVLNAWRLFSEAIRTLPDTGPYMGTGNATGNPLFFEQPPARTATFNHSWMDQDAWMGYLGAEINPYWPFTVTRMVFLPDFTNASNRAESYARSVSGIEAPGDVPVLPVFLKYLRQTTDRFGEGLDFYRTAALASPVEKRAGALREVVVAEQIHRMLLSDYAILEFEDLRLKLVAETDRTSANGILDRMEVILRDEIARTELSLLAVSRDSRLGFQFETDYVFTPYSLREKLASLRDTLDRQLPEYRANALVEEAAIEVPGPIPNAQAVWETALLVEKGRIDAVAYCGEGVVLLGSRQPNPGRVFRSSDYGQTFQELPRESGALPESNITCIWPGLKNDVYLSTGDAHVWKSEDAGITWSDRGKVSHNSNSEGAQLAYGLMVLPTGTVLMSDTNTAGGHIFRSVDEGVTWSDLGAISTRALYRFQKAGDGVIVNGWAGHVYRSVDDGLTWTDQGLLEESELFATEAVGDEILLQGSASGHVFRSTDAGTTWNDLGKIGDAADDFAYLGEGIVLYSTYAGDKRVYLSKDFGLTWAAIGPVPTGAPGDILDHVICVPDSPNGPAAVGGTVNGYVVRLSGNSLAEL